MDFSFSVNELFKEEITIVDNMMEFCRKGSVDRERFRQVQNKVWEIVDKMGEASAKAQGLHGTITTGRKLTASDHRLYVMKDSNGNSGHGSIVGLLKVGTKKLFVYDITKVQHEIQPLCVLDFYIHESRQRMGCGRKLFDFMLGREHILAQHLAIDRPSSKFLSFMARHYNLRVLIPQVYNFVVFEGFFSHRSDMGNSLSRRPGDACNNDHNIYMKPPMSGSGGWRSHNPQQLDKDTAKNVQNKWMNQNSLRQYEGSHMGASQRMYSRHGAIAGNYYTDRPVSARNCYLQDPWSAHTRSYNNHHNSSAAADQKCFDPELLSPKQMNQSPGGHIISTSNRLQGSASTPDFGGHTRNGVSSPVVINVNYLPHTIQAAPTFQLSEISTNQQLLQRPRSVLSFGQSLQPTSRAQDSHNGSDKKGLISALQRQESPLIQDKNMFNASQKYQQRNEYTSFPTGLLHNLTKIPFSPPMSPRTMSENRYEINSTIMDVCNVTFPPRTTNQRTPAMAVTDTFSSQAKTQAIFDGYKNTSVGSWSPNNSTWTVGSVLRDQQLNSVIPRAQTSSNHNFWDYKYSL